MTRDLMVRAAGGAQTVSVARLDHAAVLAAMCAAPREASVVMVVPTTTARDRAAPLIRYLLDNGPVPYTFPRWPRSAESPYEEVAESPFAAAARTGALGVMSLSESPFALVIDAGAFARRVIGFDAFMDGVYRLERGRELDLTDFAEHLVRAGYRRTSTVGEVGEFAVRGGVVDVYSPIAQDPFRLELDGDEIGTLRVFEPATQRSSRSLTCAWGVPAWEVPCGPGAMREAMLRLRGLAAERGVPSADTALVESELEQGRLPLGFAAMLPALQSGMDLLPAFLPDDAVVVVADPEGCRAAADACLDALETQYAELGEEPRLVAEPGTLAVGGDESLNGLASRPETLFVPLAEEGGFLGPASGSILDAGLALATASDVPVKQRVTAISGWTRSVLDSGQRVLFTCPSGAELRRVSDVLTAEGFDLSQAGRNGLAELFRAGEGVRIGIGRVREPFGMDMLGIALVPSEAVFGIKDALAVRKGDRRGVSRLKEHRELVPGDLVIHRLHGIGKFEGLQEVRTGGRTTECLRLTYKGGDRLLVPVDRADLLDSYTAPEEGAARRLDRLGGQSWIKRPRSAKKAARRIARMLEAIYARRASGTTHAFAPPDREYREFEATFPHETTTDQERAIEEILEDMGRDRPMDRLVCGDVGFGKTEVAVRAAYKAAMEGKQVAVLVPTTLLAEQHRLTFAARLRQTPVTVESLSRFKGSADSRRVLEGLKSGGVDVVIGTHRLLSKDVEFRSLGLLVVDEEHRFGVVHKERLREIAATVHTLTLTATPIPPAHGPGRDPRPVHYFNASQGPPGRAHVGCPLQPGTGSDLHPEGVETPGAGVRGAQPGGGHLRFRPCRFRIGAGGPRRGRPWTDVLVRTGVRDGGLHQGRQGRAGLHHNHRIGAGYQHRQHDADP
ncbi:MAG: DEAD/DEAH box helicase [Deltaproteobacteria bacterium]|nr:DEAD/DEAH box helicase [Deltaproteobacteria bacterium]